MKRKIWISIVLCVALLPFVFATNVNCGFGNGVCDENEVQYVVDHLDDKDDDLQEQINNIELIPGSKGELGEQGIQGEKGDIGLQGIPGVQGEKGNHGAHGSGFDYEFIVPMLTTEFDNRYCSMYQYEQDYKKLEQRITMIENFLSRKFGYNPVPVTCYDTEDGRICLSN
jgi:hypothetical protein